MKLGARQRVQLLQGGCADAASRCVQDALEGEVVCGLVYQPQISKRVADLLTLVKARSTDHAVGHSQRDEPLFELASLETCADQYRDLA